MLSTQTTTDNENLTIFDRTYQLAKEKNIERLKVNPLIDARNGLYTPASKLAKEGDIESVLLLIEIGASVHEAAMGAVIGKHYTLGELLMFRYGANPNYLAKGAAIAGDKEYVQYLREKFDVSIDVIAEGFAIKGDIEYVEELRKLYTPEEETKKTQFLARIIKGAVIGGNSDYAIQLHEEQKTPINIDVMLTGAVIANDIKFIEESIAKFNLDNFYLAKCLAFNGDKQGCVKLIDDNQWSTSIIYRDNTTKGILEGGVASGHLELIRDLDLENSDKYNDAFMKEGIPSGSLRMLLKIIDEKCYFYQKPFVFYYFENNQELINLAIQANDFKHLIRFYNNMYFLQGVRRKAFLNCVENRLVDNTNFSSQSLALHQLSFINDYAFLNALQNIKSLPKHISMVIPEAIKINQVMHKYNIDFDQAKDFLQSTKLRKLFLYMPFNLGDLPNEIAISILVVFSSLGLTRTQKLYEDVSLTLNKSFLKTDIEKYQSYHWIHHRKRSDSFLQASQKAESRDSFIALIRYQKDLFDNVNQPMSDVTKAKHEQPVLSTTKDEYHTILEKHARRLR